MSKKTWIMLLMIMMSMVSVNARSQAANAPTGLQSFADLASAPVKPILAWDEVSGTTWYHLYLRHDDSAVVIDEWFDAEEVCDDVGCTAKKYANTLFAEWGLLSGDYEWWIGAYDPVTAQTTYSGGESYVPATFSVIVPPPEKPFINATWDNYYPAMYVDYDDDNAFWFQLTVFGQGELFSQWYQVPNEELYCLGTCYFYDEKYLPLHWGPGEYEVSAQAWGPGGFSSLDGSDSPDSWTSDDLVFPNTPPSIEMDDELYIDSFNNDIRMDWQSLDDGTWYEVIVVDNAMNVIYSEWHHGGDIECYSDCEVIIPNPGAGEYTAYVRSWGPGGFSTGGPNNDGYMVKVFGHLIVSE